MEKITQPDGRVSKAQLKENDPSILSLSPCGCSSVMRILPRGMRSSVQEKDIITMHKTVLDQCPQQAITSFINVLRGWALFGATIFPVCVSIVSVSSSPSV